MHFQLIELNALLRTSVQPGYAAQNTLEGSAPNPHKWPCGGLVGDTHQKHAASISPIKCCLASRAFVPELGPNAL